MTTWSRKELKSQGKVLFKLNYWKCVLVSFIMILVGGGASYSGSGGRYNADSLSESINEAVSSGSFDIPPAFWGAVAGAILLALVIGLAISVLLINPLYLGGVRFYTANHNAPADLNELGYGFTSNYKGNIKTLFFKDLYVFLWSLLFVIPGIVKSYSYRMVPYILAEDPTLTTEEVLAQSRAMMDGQKWNAFVLDLSFIGWEILSALTIGILGIFYVNPYVDATNAELYFALKPADPYAIPVDSDPYAGSSYNDPYTESTDSYYGPTDEV